jgi:signal transduction histidine kinase
MTTPERLRILSVEDSEDDEQLIRAELRRSGLPFELRRVDTPDALREALREPWDVILSDYSMPSFDAGDALAIVKEAGCDVPFIIVSGSVGEEIAVQAMKAGAVDYFRKDNIQRLVPAIRREVTDKNHRADKRHLAAQLATTLENERALREQAERANRVKDNFLAVLSHELRTPLNAVLGRVHLLRNADLSPEARNHALDVIERNARAQTQLVDDLLDVSRLAAGRLTLERASVNVADAVRRAVEDHHGAAAAAGVSLEVKIDPALPAVAGDAARIRQIAANLVSNAIKFSNRGGTVGVSLTAAKGAIELVVTDNGRGFAPEHLPRVFERFYQYDQSTTRHYGGLGLGLAITRELVQLHGGTITATNQPGGGAKLRVTLPAIAAEAPRAAPPSRPAALPADPELPLSGIRILIVDDDNDARELMCDLLSTYGATIADAPDGPSALRVAPGFDPTVILTDIGMPGMDGYQLLAELRKRGVQAPSVALTAYASAEDRARAQAAGFALHVAKPIKPTRLVQDLRAVATT